MRRPPEATDTLFVYPGDGTRDWRTSEVADEGPFTPGETVGIKRGTRTGPTLYVLASGPGLRWTSDATVLGAALTGPSGPVDLVTFDRSSPQVGRYLPAGAQLLPRSPLAAGTSYTASIRLQVRGSDDVLREISRTWSFTTATAAADSGMTIPGMTSTTEGDPGAMSAACSAALRYAGVQRAGRGRRLRLQATACRATTLKVTLRRSGRTALTRTVRLKPAGRRTILVALPRSLAAGRYAVRATMAGATLALSVRVPAPPR